MPDRKSRSPTSTSASDSASSGSATGATSPTRNGGPSRTSTSCRDASTRNAHGRRGRGVHPRRAAVARSRGRPSSASPRFREPATRRNGRRADPADLAAQHARGRDLGDGREAVPNWDFDAPTQHKDSSAAAAVASALIELSGVLDLPDRDRYLQAAKRMLDELASPAYLAAGTPSPAVLLHGVGDLPEGKAVDAGLIYGDYYFIEPLARLRPATPAGTDAA